MATALLSDSFKQNVLITQVACGEPELANVLKGQVTFLWNMQGNCWPELKYLKTHLALIEVAQLFAKNKVDTETHRGFMKAKDKFDSWNQRDTQAQRTGQGTRCSWSKATSFQQFQRDSEQHARGKSDSQTDSQGEATSYKWDRSQTTAGGWANSYDWAFSKADSESHATSTTGDRRHSESEGGTPAGPRLDVGTWVLSGLSDWDLQFTGSDPILTIPFLGISVYWPTFPPVFIDNISDGFVRTLPVPPDCSYDPASGTANCQNQAIPSYGESYDGRTSFTVHAALGGSSASPGFSYSGDVRVSFTCERGCSAGKSDSESLSSSLDVSESQLTGDTLTHDESENSHDVHYGASSYRDASSLAHAGASDTMRSHGETHSGSDSASHGEGQSSGQGTAEGKDHAESHGTSEMDSDNVQLMHKWGQISISLGEMWKLIFSEVTKAEKVRAARAGASIATACFDVPMTCNPMANSFLREQATKSACRMVC